ncbi:MAG: ADP-ribosylation factor-like protein [Candidatus Ranarchaeia archaeon]|jgi:small GTP-binding protein
MITNVLLLKKEDGEVLLHKKYWKNDITYDDIRTFFSLFQQKQGGLDTEEEVEQALIINKLIYHYRDFEKFVLVFIASPVTDSDQVHMRLSKMTKFFSLPLIGNLFKNLDEKNLSIIAKKIDDHVITNLRVSLIGSARVGKTTILTLLKGEQPSVEYIPTLGVSIEKIEPAKIGTYQVVMWDFAGQERFQNLWSMYYRGSHIIFLVCDSTSVNLEETKKILNIIMQDAPDVPVITIANKQDLTGALKPEFISQYLNTPTYSMIAVDETRRDEMMKILFEVISLYVQDEP